MEFFNGILSLSNIFSFELYEKKFNKNFNIVNFWVTENTENYNYIYFLAFDEKNVKDMKELYILIYRDNDAKQNSPDYVIKINEINLFSKKVKIEKRKKVSRMSSNKSSVFVFDNIKNKKDEENQAIKEYIDYYNYKLSPKNCLFDICCSERLYFLLEEILIIQ